MCLRTLLHVHVFSTLGTPISCKYITPSRIFHALLLVCLFRQRGEVGVLRRFISDIRDTVAELLCSDKSCCLVWQGQFCNPNRP